MICRDIDTSVSPCSWYIPGGFCNKDDVFRCIEYMKNNEMEISYSGLRNYVECPRKYYLNTIKGLQMVKPPIRMLAGRVMSECLDVIHDVTPTKTVLEVLNKYKDMYQDPDDTDKVVVELCKIEGFIRAYIEHPVSEEKGKTQYEFKWRYGEGYPVIHGYMDMARCIDGKGGYGMEAKYTSHDNWLKFVVYGQISTYFLGTDLERIFLRLLKVPALKPKKGEGIKDYTERVYDEVSGSIKGYVVDVNYWRSEFDLDMIREKYRVIANEIAGRLDGGEQAFYQTENQDSHFRCEYLPICSSGVISDQLYIKREVKS